MKISIGWFYPDLMSTYGDRGNVMCLSSRCTWRGIDVEIEEITLETRAKVVSQCDLLFVGGAQDRQQKIVEQDLREGKGAAIKETVERGIPGLYICAAYQLFGHSYQPAEGETLEGLHIFDVESKHPGKGKERCIGNIVATLPNEFFNSASSVQRLASREEKMTKDKKEPLTIVGFENHGGRTYLGDGVQALAKVIKGFGNNGEDGTDGFRYKNAIGNYFHGPFLPKNPHVADWLIQTALEVKYNTDVQLAPLDDELEWKAHTAILRKLRIA